MGTADEIPREWRIKEGERLRVVVCVNMMRGPRGKCCGQSGAPEIADALEKGIRARNINAHIERIVCLGKCNDGPNVRIVGGEFRQNLSLADVPTLLDEFERRGGTAGAMLYPGA